MYLKHSLIVLRINSGIAICRPSGKKMQNILNKTMLANKANQYSFSACRNTTAEQTWLKLKCVSRDMGTSGNPYEYCGLDLKGCSNKCAETQMIYCIDISIKKHPC